MAKSTIRLRSLEENPKRQDGVFLLLLVLMTVAVYWKFLFGIQAYVFVDVGDDSYYQTIPILMNRARTLLTDLNLARYNILLGLGQFESGLNLTDGVLTLFGENAVPYMMGLFQALKTVFAGWFFYRFTRERGFDYRACVLVGLGYAFNGAMLTRLAFFSYSNEYAFVALALFALELLFKKENKWLFPLASALLVQSFDAIRAILYFLLFAVYTIFRCYVDGDGVKIRDVAKRTLQVMGLQLLGYALVAVLVLPGYLDLVASNRLETVSRAALSKSGELVNINAILTSFLRSFSNEIMGNSTTYTGRNTYVCGPAFVIGAMNVLIFPQVFVKTTNKKRIWYFLAVCAIGAYIFIAPLRLLMNGFAYDRFKLSSFWITIIMLYFGAIVWDRFFREGVFNKTLFLLTGGGVLAALLGLTLTDIRPIDTTAAWITIAVVAASMLAVLLYNKRKTALFAVLMIAVIAVDLVVNSFTSVDHRLTLSMDEYKTSYLASGIEELAESFKQDENDYFRISNFDSSYNELHCDGQANNYLSATTYDGGSGVSNEYNRFAGLVGGTLLNPSGYRTFANDDFTSMLPIQTLLGVRYRVFDQKTVPTAPVVPYGYTLSEQDGYWVLENDNALPLALAFDSVISESDLASMSQIERRESLLANAMVADDSDLLSAGLTVVSEPERALDDILNENTIPLTEESVPLTLEDETEIVRLTAKLERAVDSDYALIRVDIDSGSCSNEGETYRVYWAGEDGVFTQENSMWYSMPPGQNQVLLELPIRGAQYLRIDVEWFKDTVHFASVSEAGADYFAPYLESVSKLKEDEFTFTRLDNKRIEGSITTSSPKVLCFTFLTDSGWSATVNGEPAELQLIDGAFMGVLLNAGENEVTLSYHVPNIGVYAGISAAAAVLYSLLLVLNARGKKKKGNAA
ncbi:MAG: YfhO family protein [Clostridiaceae bacterium]